MLNSSMYMSYLCTISCRNNTHNVYNTVIIIARRTYTVPVFGLLCLSFVACISSNAKCTSVKNYNLFIYFRELKKTLFLQYLLQFSIALYYLIKRFIFLLKRFG